MSANPQAREPLWDIVEESLDEAEFLWGRWEADLSSLTRNLDEVFIWSEDRLHGALDGVRVAGDAALERYFLPALAGENARRITVCAHLMAAGCGTRALGALADALMSADAVKLDALSRGIETAALDGTFAPVANRLAQGDSARAAALCRMKSFRRSPVGAELIAALGAEIVPLRIQALHAARYAGDEASHLLERELANGDGAVAASAIESGLRLRLPAAWTAARERMRRPAPTEVSLLRWIAALGGPEDFAIIADAAANAPLARHALYALGHAGTADAVEICLGHLEGENSRAAGEAYCAITGAELERDGLVAPESDEPAPAFEDDNLDANLVPGPEALWPLPDAPAVRKHWNGIRARFEPSGRYLLGQDRNAHTLMNAVAKAPMLRRPDWIFEVAVRTQGKYDLEPRAFRATQQRQMLAAHATLAG